MEKDKGNDFGFGGIDEDGNEIEVTGNYTDKDVPLELRVMFALMSGSKVNRQTFDCTEEELTLIMEDIQSEGIELNNEEGSIH